MGVMRQRLGSWWIGQARRPVVHNQLPAARILAGQDDLPRFDGLSLNEVRAIVRHAVATGAFKYPPGTIPPL